MKEDVVISRKDFVKACAAAVCATGLCCAPLQAQTPDEPGQSCNLDELKNTRRQADAARLRFARLVEALEQNLPESERKQLFHILGGKCADTYRAALINRYKGNIKGFLEEGLRNWMAEAQYDEAAGVIRVVDKSPTCSCPMVKVGETPASFCDCTLGWQEAVYSFLLGRPVKARLEESVLRGDKRCVYRMQVV